MENFVLVGKAKTVFQIIELMAKGEELKKQRKADGSKKKTMLDNSYQLWPSLK